MQAIQALCHTNTEQNACISWSDVSEIQLDPADSQYGPTICIGAPLVTCKKGQFDCTASQYFQQVRSPALVEKDWTLGAVSNTCAPLKPTEHKLTLPSAGVPAA